jgi:putative membrane protein
MIVRPRLPWLRMLLVWKGSVVPRILPQLLLTVVLASVVVWTHGSVGGWKPMLTATPFTLFGVAMAIFLSFRNSASYERFWEARKLWGALLNDTRSLARQVVSLTSAGPEERRRLVYLLVGFTHALRRQLRREEEAGSLDAWVPPAAVDRVARARCKPAVLLVVFGEELAALRRAGQVEPILAAAFEPGLAGLSDVLGGCERIAGTPFPFTYSVIVHRIVYVYCFLLPFGLVDTVGVLTPLIVGFVAYTFFALEAVSDELAEPFGVLPNHLALDGMSRTIEASLRETLGETGLPEPLAPDENFQVR